MRVLRIEIVLNIKLTKIQKMNEVKTTKRRKKLKRGEMSYTQPECVQVCRPREPT